MVIKILIVLTLLVSLAFCVVIQLRLYNYTRKHPLPESKYTLLFRFIKLRHVNVFYLLSVLTHAFIFIWLTFYYL